MQENDDEPGYDQASEEVNHAGSIPLPDALDGISKAHANIADVAPSIAPHLAQTTLTALQFLHSKLPPPGNGLFEDRERPSEVAKKQFMNYRKIVNDPISILSHVKNATLNQQHMDAIKSVYPELHQEMKAKMIDGLATMQANGKRLAYPQRQAISLFMGQPLDSTMTPQSAEAIMRANSLQMQQPQGSGKPKKASGTELNQINKVTNLYATDSQAKTLNRK